MQIVSGSISFTYLLLPWGRKTIWIFHFFVFADARNQTRAVCTASKCAIYYSIAFEGGAVAEWSKALQLREKINENLKRSQVRPLDLGNL